MRNARRMMLLRGRRAPSIDGVGYRHLPMDLPYAKLRFGRKLFRHRIEQVFRRVWLHDVASILLASLSWPWTHLKQLGPLQTQQCFDLWLG